MKYRDKKNLLVGEVVGITEGLNEGATVGTTEGKFDGDTVGMTEGVPVGLVDGTGPKK